MRACLVPYFEHMVLKRIIVKNLQSIKDYVFELPPTGLIVFTGNNSNGKSIITKVTKAVIMDKVKKPRKRAGYVNRHSTFGEITYVRDDDVSLTVHITREAATCWYKLDKPNSEPVVRYLADKSYQQLVEEFGWHYDDYSGLTLNVGEQNEALLFYGTADKVNFSLLNSAATDVSATKTLGNLELTVKEAKTLRDKFVTQSTSYQSLMNELKIEDVAGMDVKVENMRKYLGILQSIYFPTLPEVRAVPKVVTAPVYIPTIPKIRAVPKVVLVTNVSYPTLPRIRYPRILDIHCELPDVLNIAHDMAELRARRCPTCGRGWDCEC